MSLKKTILMPGATRTSFFNRHCEATAEAIQKGPIPTGRGPAGSPRRWWRLAMTSAGDATGYGRRGTHGFTLVEIILAIVIIGISVPAFVTAFSSMKAGKNPEFAVQASFLAQKYMENLTSASCAGIPATDGAYTLTCATVDVTALDPDNAGTPVFAKKLTLTIGRTDGEMSPMDFFTLF